MRPRRQFGSVGRLPSGRWRARYTGPDGRKRTAPQTFASRADADRWLTVMHADLLRGTWTPPEASSITLAEYTTAWLRQRTPQLRPRTLDLYQRTIARWILAPVGSGKTTIDLGSLPLRAISPGLVREWHAAVTIAAAASASQRATTRASTIHPARTWAHAAGLDCAPTGRISPQIVTAWHQAGAPQPKATTTPRVGGGRTTTAQAYRVLHAILATAVDDGLVTTSPVRITGAGHVAHAERLPLVPSEVAALANAMPDHLRAAILVAAWSGLRPGEVFALRRRDLDLSTSTLTVRQALIEISGQPLTFGPPKSAAGRRTVALPALVTEALERHLTAHTPRHLDALVFTTTAGTPVTGTARSSAMRRGRTTITRPDITWHHLRHTGATLAAQAGATQADLMRRIGHSSPRAAAIYQHASATRDAHLATTLDTIARQPLG